MTSSSEAYTGEALTCWYVEPQHRRHMGGAQWAAAGPARTPNVLAGGNSCDAHAAWRRATIRPIAESVLDEAVHRDQHEGASIGAITTIVKDPPGSERTLMKEVAYRVVELVGVLDIADVTDSRQHYERRPRDVGVEVFSHVERRTLVVLAM